MGKEVPQRMSKSTVVRRDWSSARQKIEREGRCRVCGSSEFLQAAHTISRARQDVEHGAKRVVQAGAVVPLCAVCHRKYDARLLDLLPYLTIDEQHNAIDGAGGLELARKRLTGGAT